MTSERTAAANAIAHAFDLPRPFTTAALDQVRPIAAAPSLGEAVRALVAARTPRALRRALVELDALVTRAAHARTKRGERANLLAQLVLLCDLAAPLGLDPTADLRTTRRHVESLLRG